MFGNEVEGLPSRVSSAQTPASSAMKNRLEVEVRRFAWLEKCEKSSGVSRTEIRRLSPAEWSWLYRNDKEWVKRNQVPAISRHGGKKVKAPPPVLERSIDSISEDIRPSQNGLAPLPSAYQMRLALGMREYAFVQACIQLGGAGVNSRVPGWKQIFVTQRTEHALSALGSETLVQARSTVARLANLRPETLQAHSKC
ncbi:TnsD family Tn7-like transposition protein [Pandoraea pneumonica]